MKKNLFKLSGLWSLLFLLPTLGMAQVAVGDIDLQLVSNNPNNPTGICQCDTITVRYEIKAGSSFSSTSDFRYELTNSVNPPAWGAAINLSLVELWTNNNPVTQATSVLDTFGPGLKWAVLAIPCGANLFGSSLRITNRDGVGNITANGASDTAYYNINRIPTIAQIDSIALIRNQSRMDTFDNKYTTSVIDVGFCKRDTVFLRVANDGNSYQWWNGPAQIPGATDDSLMVVSSGVYYCEVIDGPCSIFSDTVTVNQLNTPTSVTFNGSNPSNANAYRVDFPNNNNSPRDSIELCENQIALLDGPLPSPATGLTFTYQWLTDSLNTVTLQRDWYALSTPTATQRTLQINQNSSVPGWNRYRLVVNDGFCQDTTPIGNMFWVNIDTVPQADVVGVPFPGFVGPTVFNEICMKDSVLLTTLPTVADPAWKYEWQWYDPSVPAGANPWKSVSGGPLSFDTLPEITIDTSLSDPGQPYAQTPKPEIRYFRVRISTRTTFTNIETCFFESDSVAVRWFPEYDITVVNSPNAFIIGQDSVNFCETDSAFLRAPATPASLINFGYNYTYQWISDSLDQNLGQRVKYDLNGETNRDLKVFETGNYWVIINDGICVDTSDRYRVFVDTLPSTMIQEIEYPGTSNGLTGLNLCLYDSAMVSATDTVLGLTPWNYQWQQWNPQTNLWMNLANDTLVTLKIDTGKKRINEDTAWFRLSTTYFNRFGLQTCATTTDSLQVIFYDSPTLSFFPGDSVGLCPGDSILFVAQGNFNTVSWNNGQVLGATRYIKIPGDYPVRAVGINNCVTRDTVVVYPLVVNASAGPDQTIKSGEIATLSAFGGTNYRWYASKPVEFSDFLSQTIQVTKVLEDGVLADTVTIYVEVTNSRGCVGIDSLTLYIQSNIPDNISAVNQSFNIFTPNGDGLNDLWDIRELIAGDNCAIVIMNRWGSVVYEDETFPGTWNGQDNGGNDLPDGTYYYILDCGGTIRMQNAITIIRNQQ